MTRVEVAIVGGGIAGLACAHELLERGRTDFLLLEAGARCGGPLETVQRDGFTIERGPSTVRRTPELERLFARAGLEIEAGRRAAPYVVSGGRLVRLPPPPGALVRGEFLPLRVGLGALAEPLRPRRPSPRSVHAFVAERLGTGLADRLADLLTLGTYGAPAGQVGFESAFPELADALERTGGRLSGLLLARLARRPFRRGDVAGGNRGLISTPRGLGALPERLAEMLGPRLRLNAPVRNLKRAPAAAGGPTGDGPGCELELGDAARTRLRARRVVLAIPPPNAAGLLSGDPLSGAFEGYRSTPQALASFALRDPDCSRRWPGFGFLAPSRERLPLLGALFASNLFEGRAPDGCLTLTVFLGPTLREAPFDAVSAELAPLLRNLLGARLDPELLDLVRYPQGIPLYDPGHRERTLRLRGALARIPELMVAGAGYDGPGLGAAAASGIAAARELAGGEPPPARSGLATEVGPL
ncbi:MAG: protoporphyrinogen oxidase [Proteobacteria bacterium]|nr:protoporphyrinogen oxidase [Pseudomonadota bacterium]